MLIQATGIIGDIKRQPAAVEPDFRPGMHRHMLGVIAVDIAADVARRDLQRAAAGEKNMGMILAHPFARAKASAAESCTWVAPGEYGILNSRSAIS